MRLEFAKLNGAGNDFILADNRDGRIALTPEQTARLCDRHCGVGADGLILAERPRTAEADWAWRFYNSDGGEAEMCGNGARCFARFVERLTGRRRPFRLETKAGLVGIDYADGMPRVELTPPRGLRRGLRLAVSGGTVEAHFIDTGVPHAAVFVPDAETAPVAELGREIRRHREFAPAGTNVDFVQRLGPSRIRVRTYERGVEGETLACGTGVAASALLTALLFGDASPITVRVQSGERLRVEFEREGEEFARVRLSGPAELVFEGTVEI